MQKRIKMIGKKHFENNFILYFILFVIFILGIIVGAILINRLPSEQNHNLLGYFSWIIDYINYGDQLTIDILKSSLVSNMKFAFIIWISGFVVLGVIIIPLIIGLKGLSIGLLVGFLVEEFGIKGFILALLGFLPYYLVIIPVILIMGSLGLSKSISNMSSKSKVLYKNNPKDIIDYSTLILLLFIIINIGSFIESFMTSYFLKISKFNL